VAPTGLPINFGEGMEMSAGRILLGRTRAVVALVVSALLGMAPAFGEPVSVNAGSGQGFVVAHRSNCYVLLPEHVHGTNPVLSLSTGAPPVTGEARVFESFVPTDLSLAIVTGGLEGRCLYRFADLPRNIDPLIGLGGTVDIVTVWASGRVQRVRGRVALLAYEEMTIDIVDPGEETDMFAGRSGGVVLAGETPVGLVVEATSSRQARALRMDAVVSRVERRLSGAPPSAEPEATADTDDDGQRGARGLVGEITYCSAEPAAPDASCWALAEGSGPLLIPADALPYRIELRLEGDGAVPVERVRLRAFAEEGLSTAPRRVIVERAAGTPDRPYWIAYAQADMSPLGEFDFSHGARPRTSTLRITVVDGWDPSLPLRLDLIDVR
jgi:hypothetical protein